MGNATLRAPLSLVGSRFIDANGIPLGLIGGNGLLSGVPWDAVPGLLKIGYTIALPGGINTNLNTADNGTITANMMVWGAVTRGGNANGAAFTDTIEAAANIYAAIPNPYPGMTWVFRYINNTPYAVSIATSGGISLSGITVIPLSRWVEYFVTLVDGNSINIQSIESGRVYQIPQTQYDTLANSANSTIAANKFAGAEQCFLVISGGANLSHTTPTANLTIAQINNWKIGGSYALRIINTNSGNMTLLAGAGATITGNAIIGINSFLDFIVSYSTANNIAVQNIGGSVDYELPFSQYDTLANAANSTIGANKISGSKFCALLISGGANLTHTTDTANNIIARLNNMKLGMSYQLRVINTNSANLTLAGGAGVVITGTAVLAANQWVDFRVTYPTANNIALQNIGAGDAI